MLRIVSIAAVIATSFGCPIAFGQLERVPASESDIGAIWEFTGLDDEERERVIALKAWRDYTDSDSYVLLTSIRLKPVFAQEAICIVEEYWLELEPREGGLYDRQIPDRSFYHWLGDTESDCQIVNAEIPRGAVSTTDLIATDAMITIMRGADDLLAQVLGHPDGSEFRDDGTTTWLLRDIFLSRVLDPQLGVAFHARFEASPRINGPSVTFTLGDNGFNVHSVGIWMY